MNHQTLVADIMRDPAASDWLKVAITATGRRDPLDALSDVAWLHEICEARVLEVQAVNRSHAPLWRHYD